MLSSIVKSKKIHVGPYSLLAKFYDQVMDHVDYEGWALYIMKIADFYGLRFKKILDIACGTGTLCMELQKRGYHVLGSDINVDMVKNACQKMPRIPFWCSDMSKSPARPAMDMVLSLYDSMNYLLKEGQWHSTFADVYRILKKNGLFVFDISTLHNSQVVFNRYRQHERLKGCTYTRKSYFDNKSRIQYNDFEFKIPGKSKRIYVEHHKQKIRTVNEVIKILQKTPFQLVATHSEFTFLPVRRNSKRVHFILKK